MNPKPNLPSPQRLREMLVYNRETGGLTWAKRPNVRILVGSVAGKPRPDGYVVLSLDGAHLLAHRVAWAMETGEWPSLVDHVDRDPTNNRWLNLRAGDKVLNAQNTSFVRSATGFRGVTVHKKTGRFVANIKVDKKRVYLGMFATAALAGDAYQAAQAAMHSWRPQ